MERKSTLLECWRLAAVSRRRGLGAVGQLSLGRSLCAWCSVQLGLHLFFFFSNWKPRDEFRWIDLELNLFSRKNIFEFVLVFVWKTAKRKTRQICCVLQLNDDDDASHKCPALPQSGSSVRRVECKTVRDFLRVFFIFKLRRRSVGCWSAPFYFI